MSKIREIDVDLKNQTAWVGTGAILAGVCPSVGIGGHFSGGGQGRIIDRNMMGEDFFWAIRGGGAASFGVVVKWKIKLVPVPPIVATFAVTRTHEEGANRVFFIWQHLIDKLPKEIVLRILITPAKTATGEPSMKAAFQGLYLGSILLQPYGGIFNEIPRSQTPFPHRAGTLYNVHYYAMWHGERT
ncbi:monolignol oxidoreductase AtBBE-like 13 [Coffea arabica]|uniref:Monolignol oxidoreductase AtBBE-like 13 n=1 Tax=Coffea arabica TaxID=13443 RepID=A0ABM4VQR0_COFAR